MEFEGRLKSQCNDALVMHEHRNEKAGGWKHSWPGPDSGGGSDLRGHRGRELWDSSAV